MGMKNKTIITQSIFYILFIAVALIQVGIANATPGSISENQMNQSTGFTSPEEIFSVPVGGFETPTVIMESNASIEINYTFFSGSWGPGPVNYKIKNWKNNTISADQPVQVSIEPASFIVGPHQKYTSKIRLTTGKTPFNNYGIRIEGRLQDGSNDSISDNMWIYQTPPPGISGLSGDAIVVNTSRISIKPGEMRIINLTFIPGRTGIGEVSFLRDDSPLTISMIPGTFPAKYGNEYPIKMLITADQTLTPGNYTISWAISHPTTHTISVEPDSYSHPIQHNPIFFYVEVLPSDNIHSDSNSMKASMPFWLPLVAIGIIFLFYSFEKRTK